MKKFYFTFLIIISLYNYSSSQQIANDNQYTINKFALSPAYAGYSQNFEAFTSYRKDWLGFEGSPQKVMLNANSLLAKNMGFGAALDMEKFSIFDNISFLLSYAYEVKITKTQLIRFGISAGLFNTNINLSQTGNPDLNDPVLEEYQMINKTTYDASFGILYNFKGLNIGVHVPRLLENKIKMEDNVVFQLKRHFIAHASYNYPVTKDVEIEPIAIVKKTLNSALYYQATILAKYKKAAWLGVIYRKPIIIGLNVGTQYKQYIINYSFEISGQGVGANTSGSHEISLGYSFGSKKREYSPQKPYYQW